MEFLFEYGLFLAKSVTVLAAILVVIAFIVGASQRQKESESGHIEVRNLNDALSSVTQSLKSVVLSPEARKLDAKQEKKKTKEKHKEQKQEIKEGQEGRSRLYVIDFKGDMEATEVTSLREEITAVLSVVSGSDEILVRVESPGGVVHGYGLAASQLQRIRNRGVSLTVAVDKVAASGGYMMACIANRVIAAPFAILGSIGVVAQLPNFHRLLQKNEIDYEVHTAGEYKRTLTLFGENTDMAREKFVEELEDVHVLFKDFVVEHRPEVDIDQVATGEAWFGRRALDRKLVDDLMTSDEYLVGKCDEMDVFQVRYVIHKHRLDKIMDKVSKLLAPAAARSGIPQQYFS